MTKHTAGPWELKVYEDRAEISMGPAVGAFNSWEPQHKITLDWDFEAEEEEDDESALAQVDEAWANAHLIAATPDLKEALRMALEQAPGWIGAAQDALAKSECESRS